MQKLLLLAVCFCSFLCIAQEVQVARDKGIVSLTIPAQKPYELMSGDMKTPTLSLECLTKGKNRGHILNFSPGGSLVDESPEAMTKTGPPTFVIKINGTKYITVWAPSGDTVSYNYYGKTEAERMEFIQSLFNAGSFSIEFKPFLTGTGVTSVFDLVQLRDEMNKYPECAAAVGK